MIRTSSASVAGVCHVRVPRSTKTGSAGPLAFGRKWDDDVRGSCDSHPSSHLHFMRLRSSSSVQSEANVFMPVRMEPVAGTAADIAVENVFDLALGCVWVVYDELRHVHHESDAAVAALAAVVQGQAMRDGIHTFMRNLGMVAARALCQLQDRSCVMRGVHGLEDRAASSRAASSRPRRSREEAARRAARRRERRWASGGEKPDSDAARRPFLRRWLRPGPPSAQTGRRQELMARCSARFSGRSSAKGSPYSRRSRPGRRLSWDRRGHAGRAQVIDQQQIGRRVFDSSRFTVEVERYVVKCRHKSRKSATLRLRFIRKGDGIKQYQVFLLASREKMALRCFDGVGALVGVFATGR